MPLIIRIMFPRYTVNKPGLGLLISRNQVRDKGHLKIIASPDCDKIRTNKHHSLAIHVGGCLPLKVITSRALTNLDISQATYVKLELDSPYLTSFSTGSGFISHIDCLEQPKNIVSIAVDKVRLHGLRHVRLIRILGVSCRLNIKPTACLEILMTPNVFGPVHSSSSSLRLLTTYSTYKPSVSHIRKNRKPLITIRGANTVVRHESCTIRVPSINPGMGLLIEEKQTTALIISPMTQEQIIREANMLVEPIRYLARLTPIGPLSEIFYLRK